MEQRNYETRTPAHKIRIAPFIGSLLEMATVAGAGLLGLYCAVRVIMLAIR